MTTLLSPHPLREEVRAALVQENVIALEQSPLTSLHALWPLPAPNWHESLAAPRHGMALRGLIERAMAQLAHTQPEDHALLVGTYFTFPKLTIKEMSDRLAISKAHYYRELPDALDKLADEIARLEVKAEGEFQQRYPFQTAFLPAYAPEKMVGVGTEIWDALLNALRARVNQSRTPILVTGLGGIGKTTLVNEGLRIWLSQEDPAIKRVLYVRMAMGDSNKPTIRATTSSAALNTLLIQLGVQLNTSFLNHDNDGARLQAVANYLTVQNRTYNSRCVLVIDDIESELEHTSAVRFAEFVSDLAIVVLVSRQNPEFPRHQGSLIRVGELSAENATSLIHTTATRAEVTLAAAEVERILRVVGGHPLALELLVPQLRQISIDEALDGLHEATKMAEVLYQRIYQRAWYLLDNTARKVLIWFTNYPQDAIPQGELSNLSELLDFDPKRRRHVITDALRELRTLNLIQMAAQMTYTLHRLTYQFVLYVTDMDDLWEYDRYDDEPDIDHPV